MEEAERLCDRVAIIDNGKIIALGSPKELMSSAGFENRVSFRIEGKLDEEQVKKINGLSKFEKDEDELCKYGMSPEYTLFGSGNEFLVHIINMLTANRHKIIELKNEKANLEDVYLNLTGKKIRD